MKEALRIAGYAGTVLLLFGVLSFALSGRFDLWTAVHVAGGGTLLLAALAANVAGVRRTLSARGTGERAQAATGAVVFVALLVALNVLAARFPKTWDATENKVYTLSERTAAVVSGLKQPVEMVGFLPASDRGRDALADLMKRYTALGPNLAFRFVDPEKEPQVADQFGVTRQGTLAVRSGSEKAQLTADASGGFGEGEITSLILKVSRPGGKRIYAITGHGEPEVNDVQTPAGFGGLALMLKDDGVALMPLLLATAPKVPDDATAVILAGPAKPLLSHELDALRAYLARGGRLAVLINPGDDAGLAPLLADYRLALDDDMIVDQEEVAFLGARLGLDPLVQDFPPHPITRGFKQRVILSQARSLTIRVEGGVAGVVVQPLAETGASAWGESSWRDMMATGRVARGDDDKTGPLLVAATAAAKIASDAGQESRLLVVGDSDWTVNGNLGGFFNKEFLANALHWLTGSEDLIVGPAKTLRASRLDMTVADQRNLFRFGVLLLPEILLIGGLVAWLRRKAL